ncbi:MAG: AraC family transcriptional regulator [Pseudomonadota bacterium]
MFGTAAQREHARSQNGPFDYGSVYGSVYAKFPQESRRADKSELSLVRVDQGSHETSDPAISDVVLRLVTGGTLSHSSVDCGNGRTTLSGRKGSFYLAPSNAVAEWKGEGRHQLLLIAVPEMRLKTLTGMNEGDVAADPLASLYGREVCNPALASLMERLWNESGAAAPEAPLVIEGLLMMLLGSLIRTAGSADSPPAGGVAPLEADRLSRVVDFIDAHLGDSLLIEDLARVACLSQYHFCRRFRASMNTSPHAFVTARRVVVSRQMLSDSDRTLTEIALACGFSNQAHFTTQFKAHIGQPPGAYRASIRG